MGFFSSFNKSSILNRKFEEQLYSLVAQELAQNIRHDGLWIQALSLADGNKEKQLAEYIKLRAQSIKDDAVINSRSHFQNTAQVRKEKKTEHKKVNLGLSIDFMTGKVLSVDHMRAASKAGLQAGDRIISINDTLLRTNTELISDYIENQNCTQLTFEVKRGSHFVCVTIPLK